MKRSMNSFLRRRWVAKAPWMAVCSVASAVLGGCAVGPDFNRPAPPDIKGYQSEPLPATVSAGSDAAGPVQPQHLIEGMDIPAQWWTLFHSQPLNDLIEQALEANPDVKAAQAALRGAWENVYAQRGAYFPTVMADVNPTRQKMANPLASIVSSGSYIFNVYTAQVSVAYVPDVFGGNRRQVESLQAQAEMQRFELEATYLTLITNLVNAALTEAALRAQIDATYAIIEDQTRTLASFRRQLVLGQVAEADVAAQEAQLAQAEAALPPLEKQLAQQRDLIAALAGRFPGEKLTATFEWSGLSLPKDLPVSLPSKLVEQRPDIRAAEEQLHAASAQIGVAVANRLPNIQLTGNIGSTATEFNRLFTSGTGFWGIAADISQPIFDGGTLLHKERAARAAFEQAKAQYRSTVIAAFQNVADTLHAIQSDTDAVRTARVAALATARSLAIARRQLALGDISELTVLTAEASYRQAEINFVQAQVNRYTDAAALFQALGGGWWNRSKESAASL
jgi:NodT family efflux transporter outer membrane factor (OMF) lipoprotein